MYEDDRVALLIFTSASLYHQGPCLKSYTYITVQARINDSNDFSILLEKMTLQPKSIFEEKS